MKITAKRSKHQIMFHCHWKSNYLLNDLLGKCIFIHDLCEIKTLFFHMDMMPGHFRQCRALHVECWWLSRMSDWGPRRPSLNRSETDSCSPLVLDKLDYSVQRGFPLRLFLSSTTLQAQERCVGLIKRSAWRDLKLILVATLVFLSFLSSSAALTHDLSSASIGRNHMLWSHWMNIKYPTSARLDS